jgi:hypothetical protein
MNIIHPFAVTKKYWLLVVLILSSTLCNAQNILERANDLLKKGTDTANELSGLVTSTKKSTADFNQSVKVVADVIPVSTVPKDQLTKPKFKRGKFTNFTWEPVAHFEKQMFPAMIISMANYTGNIEDATMNAVKSSALGFSFVSEKNFIPIRWEIESSDKTYFDKAGGDFVMQQAKQSYCFMPAIPWNMSTLAKQANTKPLTIIYRLYDAENNKEERSETVFMRSINDCIYAYQQKSFDFLFAAFVQEQHPQVAAILKEAAKTKFSLSASGYQADELQTLGKVCALWKVLHDRGLQFGDGASTPASSPNIKDRQVKTFDNTLKAAQGTSFDGSVLLASLLRGMGLNSVMLVSHDHCLVGFYANNKPGKKLICLETVMLVDSEKIDAAKTAKQKSEAYVAEFLEAVKIGAESYAESKTTNDMKEIDLKQSRNVVQALPY